MKSGKSYDEIGDLLRSSKPGVSTPTGLEMQILRALDERRHPAPESWWPWLLLPPACAALTLVMLPLLTPQSAEINDHRSTITSTPSTVTETDPAGPDSHVLTLVVSGNPLAAESDALSRDMQRAGDFLVACLPSIASTAE
jgi:hypothetical protein